MTARSSKTRARQVEVPRSGVDGYGNEVVLVWRLGRERPGGVECEHCGDCIRPDQAAYRDPFLSTRGNWYTHASPGECIEIVEVDPDEGWTRIPLAASR